MAISSSENRIQGLLHALEQGGFRWVVQRLLIVLGTISIAVIYLGALAPTIPFEFRGFSRPEAMDQAQIAREIAEGNGFSTKFLRPLALKQMEHHNGTPVTGEKFPDTFNAPLGPFVNAAVLHWFPGKQDYKNGLLIPPVERAISALAMVFLVASVIIQYFLIRRLFDERLASTAAGLVLVCDLMWRFTISGLPQMLMLFIFSGVLYAMVLAVEAAQIIPDAEGVGKSRPFAVLAWMGAAGVGLGLLALAHAVAIGIVFGAAVFAVLYFKPRGSAAIVLLAGFALVYAPWLVRTYEVCGNPFGLSGYAIYNDVGGSLAHRMRSVNLDLKDYPPVMLGSVPPFFLHPKIQAGIASQFASLTANLGGSLIAVAFFLALLHPFKRLATGGFRWAILFMWAGAVFSMAVLGTDDDPVNPGQLHVLFLPIMIAYGLGLILVLFSRLSISTVPLLRTSFFILLFAVSAVPMLNDIFSRPALPIQYPPYMPSVVAQVGTWTDKTEVTASDMPWAVAWYADRKSIWIPLQVSDLMSMSDSDELPGRLAGILMSPVTRNAHFLTEIVSGEYENWRSLIVGQPAAVKDFPFQEALALPLAPGGSIFYSDTKRWLNPPKP